jgi:hypothetical protein
MRDLFDLLRAGLTHPEDLAHYARSIEPRRLYLENSVLLLILAAVIIAVTTAVGGLFQPQFLLILPLAFLLTGLCGLLAFVWAVNSKGEGTLYQTVMATPASLFFPTLVTIALLTVNRLMILPTMADGPTIVFQLLDVVSSLLGPIFGCFLYAQLLRRLHNLKGKHAVGASLVSLFVTLIAAYLLGNLL